MFQTDPGLVPIPDQPDLWYLDGPLVWVGQGLTITIPTGFITDDASIPKFLDWIPFLDRQGLSRRPGVCHDGLYSLGRIKGKAFSDMMLEQFCLDEGMKEWQAAAYYYGVHWFGDSSYAGDSNHGTINPATIGDFINKGCFDKWVANGQSIYS